jgi:protein TonB
VQADDLDLKPPRAARIGFALLIVLLHLAAIYGLMRAFAPEFTANTVNEALSVFNVTVPPPDPPSVPKPPPQPQAQPDEGAAGDEGRKAIPREVAAPKAKIPISQQPVPPIASTGNANSAGAAERGTGTGAGGAGDGLGSGRGGNGRGGMVVRGVEKIAGDINSARDYPKKSRDLRLGHSVTIVVGVGTDGRVTDCRISQPSPDPAADAITCRLAQERFRFRPAMNGAGEAVAGKYAWRQRWFQ